MGKEDDDDDEDDRLLPSQFFAMLLPVGEANSSFPLLHCTFQCSSNTRTHAHTFNSQNKQQTPQKGAKKIDNQTKWRLTSIFVSITLSRDRHWTVNTLHVWSILLNLICRCGCIQLNILVRAGLCVQSRVFLYRVDVNWRSLFFCNFFITYIVRSVDFYLKIAQTLVNFKVNLPRKIIHKLELWETIFRAESYDRSPNICIYVVEIAFRLRTKLLKKPYRSIKYGYFNGIPTECIRNNYWIYTYMPSIHEFYWNFC